MNEDGFDRRAYLFCCLDRLRSALRKRDIFIAQSVRYADARLGFLTSTAWNAARSTICRSLGHSPSAEEAILSLSHQLDQTHRTVAEKLPANLPARVEAVDGEDELIVSAIDKLEEPNSLVELRAQSTRAFPASTSRRFYSRSLRVRISLPGSPTSANGILA